VKKIIIILFLLPLFTKAQNSITIVINAEGTKASVKGATVQFNKLKFSGISDSTGKVVFNNIPGGKWEIEISSIGYKDVEKEFTFPLSTAGIIQIYLEQAEQELDEVTVSSTRSNRSIRNTPARVEVIAEEEVHEEATMRRHWPSSRKPSTPSAPATPSTTTIAASTTGSTILASCTNMLKPGVSRKLILVWPHSA